MTPPTKTAPPINQTLERQRNWTAAALSLRSPKVIWGAAWTALTLILIAYAYKSLYPGDLVDADAMDFAQIARNIAGGHGYATSILRPLALSGFVTAQAGTAPDISRAPLYPFLLMVGFVLHGGHGGGNMVVLTSLLLFAASTGAVFLLARTLFPDEGRPWPALLSAGLYLLSGGLLVDASAGLPTPLVALLVTGLFIALYRSHEVGGKAVSAVSTLAVGVMLGLCYLAQYSLLLLALPTLVYVYATRMSIRAWRSVAGCILGFFIVTLPWMIRTAVVAHNGPFFSLLSYGLMADTSEYPGVSTIYRSVMPSDGPLSFLFSHLPEMAAKAGKGLAFYQAHLSDAFNVFVLAPALAALLWRFGDVRVRALRGFAAFCLLLMVFGTVLFAPSEQLLAPFTPIVTVIGVAFVFELMASQRWQPLSQRITLWTWAVLVGGGLIGSLIGHAPVSLNPVQNGISMLVKPPLASPLNGLARQRIISGTVMTDTPWEVTWRTGLPALWLPRDNQAYQAVVSTSGVPGSVVAPSLLLTPNIAAYTTSGEADAWIQLAEHPHAWEDHTQSLENVDRLPQVFQSRAALANRLLAAHDPRLHVTSAQLHQQEARARELLPAMIKTDKNRVQSAFDNDYGSISEVLADYDTDPNTLEKPEANHAVSTLFLRRDFLSSLETNQ